MTNSDEHSSDSDQGETLEVQVQKATRKKGLPSHKATGKQVQKVGAETRRQQGAASKREKEVERLQKANDRLAKLNKISELEAAERERAELLKQASRERTAAKDNAPKPTVAENDINAKLTRLEELIMARQAEATPAKKKRGPAKKAAAPPDSSTDEDEEPPRQKAVRKSAKAELKKKGNAQEEMIHNKAHLVGNKNKQKAMHLDQERQFMEIGQQLFPGRW